MRTFWEAWQRAMAENEQTGEGLRAALEENPADTARWLIYADWCGENGREQESELVRLLADVKQHEGATSLSYHKIRGVLGVNPDGFSWKQLVGALKRAFPFAYDNLVMKSVWLRSFMEIDRKNFRGKMLPFYQLGFYVDEGGNRWEAFSPRGNAMSSWVRLERPNVRARFAYDPGHHLRREINRGREYIPGVSNEGEATRRHLNYGHHNLPGDDNE